MGTALQFGLHVSVDHCLLLSFRLVSATLYLQDFCTLSVILSVPYAVPPLLHGQTPLLSMVLLQWQQGGRWAAQDTSQVLIPVGYSLIRTAWACMACDMVTSCHANWGDNLHWDVRYVWTS